MQRIRISQNVVLEITDDIVSRPLNATPYMHIYEYGNTYGNQKQVVLTDGQTEERAKSFWSANGNNTILSSTPNFYLDNKISANFHNNHRVDTLLSPTVMSSSMQYRKVRMLFAQGFAYSTNSGAVAMTTLNISAIRPSNNARIDLLSFYDVYDNSSIQAIPQVLYDNQLFNSAIELNIIDLAFLFNSTATDVVAVKNRLFGTDDIDTLFIEHAGVPFSEITSFTEFGNTYKKFSDSNRTRSQFTPRYNNQEIICDVTKLSNGTVTAQMKHERFSLQGFLERTSKVVDISYTYKFDEYNASNVLLGSKIIKISSPTSLFNNAEFRLQPQATTDHINVSVEGYILQEDNNKILRSGSVVITDVSVLKSIALTATIQEEKLIRSETKQIKQVVYKPDTPKIINIEKPVFVQVEPIVNKLTLMPYNQALKISTTIDLSLVRRVKLVIGESSYYNVDTDKLTFRVGSEAYYQKDKSYFLLDEQENVIAHGLITRVKN